MATRKRAARGGTRSAAAGSWLALLAATTLGDGADTLHAEVRADGLREGAYRLVVQSYDASDGRRARPATRARWQHAARRHGGRASLRACT